MEPNLFSVNGCFFEDGCIFPTVDEAHAQEAVMIMPVGGELVVFLWNCFVTMTDTPKDFWAWEPLCPLKGNEQRVNDLLADILKKNEEIS